MSAVEVIPLTDFVHGAINARQGMSFQLDHVLAEDLARNGLLRIKMGPGPSENKMLDVQQDKSRDSGNVPAAGAVPPSSASPAAPASPQPIANASSAGATKRPKAATS